MTRSSEDVSRELAREEARLATLERERAEAATRVAALRARLGAGSFETATLPAPPEQGIETPTTPAEKVRLFRSLFRGREDVFATRFVSKKAGKPGYAPACTNKFVPGVCQLPKIKCGECPNQAFALLDDRAVLDHLRGRHVLGVYPLLEDETCWFLAVDFDKSSWMDDTGAFVDVSRSMGLPPAVERSRSGNGAHVWFFFSRPVSAHLARKMGCYLLTETMSRRHQLSMRSYDRLFPNQDTLPRGGFGNLIALPLQQEARLQSNTVFVDGALRAFEDQWRYMASLPRISTTLVVELASEASRRGLVMGVRATRLTEEETLAPWMCSPSRRRSHVPIVAPLPREVRAVFAQRLFVETLGLPSALLSEIKRLAAFQNPDFYRKQSLRLSTATTPRVISCAEELSRYVALPRGCLGELRELLREQGVELVIEDQRREGEPLELRFQGELTPLQQRAARALVEHDQGVLVAPPGVGKTVLGTYLVARRGKNTLVLVHRQPLLDQWVFALALFLGIEPAEIGQVGGGRRKPTGRLDVAMIQSLVRKEGVDDLVEAYGQVIVDECHHVPAVSFERVLSAVKARYVVGFTATPYRRDGHHPILEMQLGPVRFTVDARSHAARRPFAHRLIARETTFRLEGDLAQAGIQSIFRALASSEERNRLILEDVRSELKQGRFPMLLTERRDQLEHFATELAGSVPHLVVLHGGISAKKRRELSEQLARDPGAGGRLVLASGRYIGEGFDDARLDSLLLAMPVSWKGTLVQYTGRLHRLHPDKSEVRIFDYVDRGVPVLLRMFERRLRAYRAIGYSEGLPQSPGSAPPSESEADKDKEAP